jgi:redox-sensing transcriptional repressor
MGSTQGGEGLNRPPEISVSRLAVYLRFLEDYSRQPGAKNTINSQDMAGFLDLNPHQIRKDFSYFGKFGERGVGYRIPELVAKMRRVLGLDRSWNLCLCGMGNLGSALFAYQGFREKNLNIVAVFDTNPAKVGKMIRGVMVYHPKKIREVVKRSKIEIAILAVPSPAAQEIANDLVSAGVRAVLNFAPLKLTLPKDVGLRNVDFSTDLSNLTHFLSRIK